MKIVLERKEIMKAIGDCAAKKVILGGRYNVHVVLDQEGDKLTAVVEITPKD